MTANQIGISILMFNSMALVFIVGRMVGTGLKYLKWDDKILIGLYLLASIGCLSIIVIYNP
jgi:hypothetical protein